MKKLLIVIFFVGTTGVTFAQARFTSGLFAQDKTDSRNPIFITTPSTESPVYIDFVGSGDIQKSLNQGDEIQANTGLGIIFERYNGPDKILQSLELETVLNIASTVDSITAITTDDGNILNRRDFGSYLINPVSKKNSIFLDATSHLGTDWRFINSLGINIRYVASNNIWSINENAQHLGGQYFRIGLFYEFIPDNYRLIGEGEAEEGRAIYSLYLGVHRTYRRLLGDLSSDDFKNERLNYLGNEETRFRGYEVNIGFRLRNIRAEFQLPMLNAKNDGPDVRGLTNRQFIFTIRFVGGFGLKLDKNDSLDRNDSQEDENGD